MAAPSLICSCALSSVDVAAGIPFPPGALLEHHSSQTNPGAALGIMTCLNASDFFRDFTFTWSGLDAAPCFQGAMIDPAHASALIRGDSSAAAMPWGSKGALMQHSFLMCTSCVSTDDALRCMSHRDLSGSALIRIYGAFLDASGWPAPPYTVDASGRVILFYELFDGINSADAVSTSVATLLGVPSFQGEGGPPHLICGPAFARVGCDPDDRDSGISILTKSALIFRDQGIGFRGALGTAFTDLERVWWKATDPTGPYLRKLSLRRARDAGMSAIVFATVHDDMTLLGGATETLLLYVSSPQPGVPVMYASSDAPDELTLSDPDAQILIQSSDSYSFKYVKPLLGPAGSDRSMLAGLMRFPSHGLADASSVQINPCDVNLALPAASIPMRLMQLWNAVRVWESQSDLPLFDVGGIAGLEDATQIIADAIAASLASHFVDPANVLALAQAIDALQPEVLINKSSNLGRALVMSDGELTLDIHLRVDIDYDGFALGQVPCTLQLRGYQQRASVGTIGYSCTATQLLDAHQIRVDYIGASMIPTSCVLPWRIDPNWQDRVTATVTSTRVAY